MRDHDTMKLSFVIPTQNEGKHIRRYLLSVAREAKKSGWHIENIVVNNSSVDRTSEIALEFTEVIAVDKLLEGLRKPAGPALWNPAAIS